MADRLSPRRENSTVHVAVLKGGWSSEREVSLVSGAACARALREEGYDVSEIDAGHDIAQVLADLKPDVVFNALHGTWGEDGCVQGILEVLDIPYTHSGVLASALAMNKPLSKNVFLAAGLPCEDSVVVARQDAAARHVMATPYVIKPLADGSSVGVFIVEEGANAPPQELCGDDWTFGENVMVEKYVPGRELTVAVMGDRALAVTEIIPQTRFYDYQAKYAEGGSVHVLPADIPDAVRATVMRYAVRAHKALGCRGVSRADFRYDDTQGSPGRLVLLEVNTQPGMTPTSLVPEQAQHVGLSFGDLVRWMVEDASCRR